MTDKRVAIIVDGLVSNVVVVLVDQEVPEGGVILPEGSTVGPGWTYDGEDFTPPAPAHIGPVRVSKADFQRLFAASERYNINALRKTVAAITPAEYADPANVLILAAEDVLYAFEQPLEFIELDHPETAQGLQLLAYLDVIAPERIAEIICNVPPV